MLIHDSKSGFAKGGIYLFIFSSLDLDDVLFFLKIRYKFTNKNEIYQTTYSPAACEWLIDIKVLVNMTDNENI